VPRLLPFQLINAAIHGSASLGRTLPTAPLAPDPHPSSPRTDLTLLTPHTRHLQFVADMALAFTETVTPDEALSFALERICHFAGWHYGEVWLPRIADNGTITLICSPLWHSHDSAYWQDFRDLRGCLET
ncbi:MAG: hypothetical protein ACO4AJ_02890, partial [Prochlorothrix sp.]